MVGTRKNPNDNEALFEWIQVFHCIWLKTEYPELKKQRALSTPLGA